MRSAKNPSTSHSRPGATDAWTEIRNSLSDSSSTCSIRGLRKNVVGPAGRIDATESTISIPFSWSVTKTSSRSSFAPLGRPNRRDLRVVDVDHLAVQRPQPRVPEQEVLDDALQLVHRDLDRVADRVPALDEHGQAAAMMSIRTLHREADQDQDEGCRCRQAIDTADQLADGEHGCSPNPR